MGNPKVSLLMGTYNRPQYLREAIQSVIAQTMPDWELILMNDGGVDVEDIVQEIGDQRIRYFHDPVNKGFAYRLNEGLNRASGQYIAYLGDDDLYYPDHFKILSKTLDEHPDIGAAYSDLYAVQFLKDESTGRRYPLNKWIQVARDFNRDFLFHFNHTLHVSLMHRRDLAMEVGGYDANVTVLIDWNMTRKLCFYTDFKYIPIPTGEYYMPVGKSDRISNLERQDQEKYKHNLRKIKGNLPPEPWPKVHRVGVIMPISRWTDEMVASIKDWIDQIAHPVRYALVNIATDVPAEECRERLGNILELKNVTLLTPERKLTELAAYRLGAEKLDVDFVYLPTQRADRTLSTRILSARPYLDSLGHGALKWDRRVEIKSPFDCLMGKKRFLKMSGKGKGKLNSPVQVIKGTCPLSMKWDFLYSQADKAFKDGNYPAAYRHLRECFRVDKGGGGEQYLVDLFAKVCFGLKNYDEAEDKCREIIGRGYGADNWIRMGKIHQYKNRHEEAVQAYRKALSDIGLDGEDISRDIFLNIMLPDDLGAFKATIGLAEGLIETGDLVEASRVLRRAARLAVGSPRPFLGFARLFLKTGDTNKAREGVGDLLKRGQISGEVYQVLGTIEEKAGNRQEAYRAFAAGLSLDPADPEIQDGLYRIGSALGWWEEMRTAFEEALRKCPESKGCARYVKELEQRFGPRTNITDWFRLDGEKIVLPAPDVEDEFSVETPRREDQLEEARHAGALG